MTDTVTKLLQLQIAMSGIDKAETAFLALARTFGANAWQLDKLEKGMEKATRGLAPLLALVSGEVAEGVKWELAQTRMEAFTHSASLAADQMEFIEHVASRGMFKMDALERAVTKLDEMNINLKDTWDLVEKLGARSGSIEGAADIVARIAGGRGHIPYLVNRLRAMGISPQMLAGAGLNVNGNTIKNSPAQILDALKKIEAMDPVLNKMQGTLGMMGGALVFNASKLLQIMSSPAMLVFKVIGSGVNYLLQGLIQVNKWTFGLLGHFLGIMGLVAGFEKIAKIWALIGGSIKIAAFWQGVLNTYEKIMVGMKALLQGIVWVYDVLRGKIQLAALWQAVLDAFMGNWEALAAGAAVAAVVGIGIYASNKAMEPPGEKPADRPHRRDDIENVYKKLYGRAWTG